MLTLLETILLGVCYTLETILLSVCYTLCVCFIPIFAAFAVMASTLCLAIVGSLFRGAYKLCAGQPLDQP